MAIDTKPAKWKILLAFAVIYFVWGSTYFAIKVGVHEVPPLTYAAMRFFVAGLALCAWAVARGEKLPDPRQWLSVCVLAVMVFVIDYGALFWAEQHVPSGIAAVVMATISVFMALSEIVFLRTRKFTLHLALALLVGLVLFFKLLIIGIPLLIAIAVFSFLVGFFRRDEPRVVYVESPQQPTR